MPRLTIDVGTDFDKVLSNEADNQGLTKAELIRRAVASYVFLTKQTDEDRNGGRHLKVSITDEQDRVLKDVVLSPKI